MQLNHDTPSRKSYLSVSYGLNNLVKEIAQIVNPARPKIMKRRDRGWRTSLLAFSGGWDNYNTFRLLKSATDLKKINTSTPLRHPAKRSVDISCIIESSGEPVSKYRVRSLARGVRNISCFQERRPAWDTAHSFSGSSFEAGSL